MSVNGFLCVHDPEFNPGLGHSMYTFTPFEYCLRYGVPFRHKLIEPGSEDGEQPCTGNLYVYLETGRYLGFFHVPKEDKNSSCVGIDSLAASSRFELNLPTLYARNRNDDVVAFNEREGFEEPLFVSRPQSLIKMYTSMEITKGIRKHIIFVDEQLRYFDMNLMHIGNISTIHDNPKLLFCSRHSHFCFYEYLDPDTSKCKVVQLDFKTLKIVNTWDKQFDDTYGPNSAHVLGTSAAYKVRIELETIEIPGQDDQYIPSVVVDRFLYASMNDWEEEFYKITFPQRPLDLRDEEGSIGEFHEIVGMPGVDREDNVYFAVYRNYHELYAKLDDVPVTAKNTVVYKNTAQIRDLDIENDALGYANPPHLTVTDDHIWAHFYAQEKIQGWSRNISEDIDGALTDMAIISFQNGR